MPQIRFFQTSDPHYYLPMLRLSEQTVGRFCHLNSILYEQVVGLYRGIHAWQATYNRIFYLHELLASGYRGWLIYADADCVINDLAFPIKHFLYEHKEKCLIIASGRHGPNWAVNAGVFLLNFSHPHGIKIIREWYDSFQKSVPDRLLFEKQLGWDAYPNDQTLLHDILRDNPSVLCDTLIDDGETLNYHGTFIRQALRAHHTTFQERCEWMTKENSRILTYFESLTREDQIYKHDIATKLAGIEVASSEQRSLTQLADFYGSDKGSIVGAPPHNYTSVYDIFFSDFRDRSIKLVELGLGANGPELGGSIEEVVESPSVQMFLDYFAQGQIYGFDIRDFSHLTRDRFTFIRGDLGSESDIERLADAEPEFDIVIDDGSHASYHQQLALKTLFPKIAPGGIYVIENIHWQPASYEASLPKTVLTRDLLSQFFRRGVYLENPIFTAVALHEIKEHAVFYHEFRADSSDSGMIMIMKRNSTRGS